MPSFPIVAATGFNGRAGYPGNVTKPLDTIRRLPAVGVLAERQMGGFLAMSALVGVGVGLGAAGMVKLLDLVERAFADFDLDNGTVLVSTPQLQPELLAALARSDG